MKPVEIEFLMRNKTRDGFAQLGSDATATERDIQSMQNRLTGLMAEYRKLHALIRENPKMDQSGNIAMLDALQDKIEELQSRLRQAGGEVEDFGRTMPDTPVMPKGLPNATRQFNGLHMSIQQIAREMPSLAMGPQMFFLAISNNLPILADNIALARKEYDALVASGQKGVPVWKQVVKSLFSWQTALTTGIMLLVMYGKDIANWAKELFVGKTALDELRESMQKTYELEKSAHEAAVKTRIEMTQTMNRIKEFNGTRAEERRLVDELNGKYGESFGYFQTLAEWYDTLTSKSEAYINILFEQAKQQSLMNKIVEADDKINKIQATPAEDYQTFRGYGGKVDVWWKSIWGIEQGGNGQVNKNKALTEAKKEKDALTQELENSIYRENYHAGNAGIGEVIDGSIKDLENIIAAKRKALKDITNKADYDAAMAEVQRYEKMLESITGASDNGGDNQADGNARNAEKLGEMELAARRAVEEQIIAIDKDGYERERAEADLAFKREKERLEAEKAEYLRIYSELEKAGYKVDPTQKQKVTANYDMQVVNAASLRDKDIAAINAREKKQTDDHIADLLGKYQDYAARRTAIEEKYQADIAELEAKKTSGAVNGRDADAAIAEAKRRKDAELDRLDKEISNSAKDSSAMLQAVFSNATSQSKKEIEGVIEYAQKLIKLLNGTDTSDKLGFTDEQIGAMSKDSELIQQLLQNIINKKEELYGRGGHAAQFIGGIRQIGDALQMTDQEQKTEGVNAGMKRMVQSGMAINSAFGQMADSLTEIAELSGNDALGGVADTMQKAADTLSSTLSGAAAGAQIGGVYGAIAGGVLGLFTSVAKMTMESEAKHWAALEEVNRARLDYQRQYNLLLLEQKLLMEEAEGVFGEKSVQKAANALKVYQEALDKLDRTMSYGVRTGGRGDGGGRVSTTYPDRGGSASSADPNGARASGNRMRNARQAYRDSMRGLASATVVTGHEKTGLFGWGKGRDVYSNILDVYPKLVDETGKLDAQLLQTILNTQKMDDSTRRYLESLVELDGVMQEAEQAFKDYLGATFGELGDGILDSVTAALDGSQDRLEGFARNAAGVLENLGEQIAYSLFFADEFAKLQEDLEGIYGSDKSEEQMGNEVMDLLDEFMDGIADNAEKSEEWLRAWQEKAAQKGFDLWKDGSSASQTGKAGAISQSMTYDQGNRLEGLWTATVQHVASADLKLDNVTESLGRSLEYQQRTADNTDSLPLIYSLLAAVKRDGLKVR